MDHGTLLESPRNQLGRVLGFFRVDARPSVLLAVNSGMLAFLAAKVPPLNTHAYWDTAIPVALVYSLWFACDGPRCNCMAHDARKQKREEFMDVKLCTFWFVD